ncbi:hypothetical protein [Methanoculleus chikugoensis]|uniref:hypothetical protein n=1 Tax=Methanoculleus chikugoensis TaxID=118126 RepID=UPI000A497782|nr:hypothetical protein [Methanoculleus chikugoensis]
MIFCGTGGILLEAREIGVRILGSDFDPPAMVDGYRQNLPGVRCADRRRYGGPDLRRGA